MNFVVDTISGICYFLFQVWWSFFVPVTLNKPAKAIIEFNFLSLPSNTPPHPGR
jgi:hypothetical protein